MNKLAGLSGLKSLDKFRSYSGAGVAKTFSNSPRPSDSIELGSFANLKLTAGLSGLKSLDKFRSYSGAGVAKTFSNSPRPSDSISLGSFANLKLTAGPQIHVPRLAQISYVPGPHDPHVPCSAQTPYVVGPTQTLHTSSVVGPTQTPSVLRPAVTSRVLRPRSPPGKIMTVEVRITNTPAGFVIHNLVPISFRRGARGQLVLHRVCKNDDKWVDAWMPYVVSHVNALPQDLLKQMHLHWHALKGDCDRFWAKRFLRHGVEGYVPVMDNYWRCTINACMPFFEDGPLSLDTLLANYPRGVIYDCDPFRQGVSYAAQAQISARYRGDEVQDIVLSELAFLVELEDGEFKRLLDHIETKAGKDKNGNFITKFHFKGSN